MLRTETLSLSKFALTDMIRCGVDIRQMGADAESESVFCGAVADYFRRWFADDYKTPAVVLTRFFRTCSFADLDDELRAIVTKSMPAPDPSMKCLRLMATAGVQPEWNDPRASAGHRVIALPSPQVVQRMPMVAQLIRQLGLDLQSLLAADPKVACRLRRTGVFHVERAKANSYIPAQADFVIPFGVRSVVGFGDVLPDGNLFAVMVFSRATIGREAASLFSHLSLSTKVALIPHLPYSANRSIDQINSLTELIGNYEEVAMAQDGRLRALVHAAEDASRAKSGFLANMSHEIRTPMTAIMGFTDILLSRVQDPDSVDAAQTIKRNADYLLDLINDILDLSKIEAGKVDVESLKVSPESIVAEVASLMRVRADAKGLPLRIAFDGPIPETIRTDPTRLRQILINVVGNAIKFTETGFVELKTCLINGHAPKLRFDVIDTGIGIPSYVIDRIFQPFSQGDNSMTRRYGGTGLGLAITKRLVEILGGEITVSPGTEGGTTFSVTIATGDLAGVNLRRQQYESATLNRSSRPTPDAKPIILLGRILLAEDGPDNQRLLAFILRQAGAEVVIADNGKSAVEMATEALANGQPFDAILMDMQMPIMDGYTAARTLRSAGYANPIIALTAHAMSGDREKCLAAGCDAFATKPVERNRLIELLARYCRATAAQP